MRTSKVVVCLLLASLTLADINADYESVLNGATPLEDLNMDQMYEQFLDEYKDGHGFTPSSKYVLREADRKAVFSAKVKEIKEFNSDSSNTYKKAINAFSDMTEDEFFDYYHLVGDAQECSATKHSNDLSYLEELKDIPSSWDWRDQGVVTPVKNQGKCGSCWTFSTIGCLESHYMMKYGQFRNLSEQ